VKNGKWKTYAFWIVLSEAVGALAGWLTREGTELYRTQIVKPPLSPPAIVFPIAWAILYALMGAGAARAALTPASAARLRALRLFAVQLAFNFCWSLLFFNLRAFGVSFFWLWALWVLILLMARAFFRLDRPAGCLQLPYLLWVAFAGYLNAGVWLLNP